MKKLLLPFSLLLIFSSFSDAQSTKGYAYATGNVNSTQYPLKLTLIEDTDCQKDIVYLSNGRCFPILNRIIRTKKEYVGGVLENMTTKEKTKISDMHIMASGSDDAKFTVKGANFSSEMSAAKGGIMLLEKDFIILWDGRDYWKLLKKS
jgi:hypothetical protein